jgi:hypothetical protein
LARKVRLLGDGGSDYFWKQLKERQVFFFFFFNFLKTIKGAAGFAISERVLSITVACFHVNSGPSPHVSSHHESTFHDRGGRVKCATAWQLLAGIDADVCDIPVNVKL